MKAKIEISSIEEVSVEEALQLLRNVVEKGAIENGGPCGAASSREPHFICNRHKGHTGRHIATGSSEIYEIWRD